MERGADAARLIPPAAPPRPSFALPRPNPSPSLSAPPHRPGRAVLVFLAVTFAITWTGYAIAHFSPESGPLMVFVMAAGPTIGAVLAGVLVMKRAFPGVDLHPRFDKRFLFVLALLVPVVLALLADGVTGLATHPGSLGREWVLPNLSQAIQWLVVFALLEEIGWRGILYPCLERRGAVIAGLVTGFIWGIWHLPWMVWAYHESFAQIAMFVAGAMLASIPLGILTTRARSVWPATIAHAAYNYAAASGVLLANANKDVTFYRWMLLAGMACVAVAALVAERGHKPVSRRFVGRLATATGAVTLLAVGVFAYAL